MECPQNASGAIAQRVTVQAWRVLKSDDNDAEEAKLRSPQNRPRALGEWSRSEGVYHGRRS